MAISKKIRFEVFKRDGFQCQYCGKMPPEIILHADHVLPKKQGGMDNVENLISACSDCNLGKGATLLSEITPAVSALLKKTKEKELQLKEFYKYQKIIEQRIKKDIKKLCEYWEKLTPWEDDHITERGKLMFKNLLRMFPFQEIVIAIELTMGNDSIEYDGLWRYMCGVLWKRKKQRENIGDANGERENDK